jgi:tRNA-specific 2-thiouridylase
VTCNVKIKFKELKNWVLDSGRGDWYATGHYAAVRELDGRLCLSEPRERRKSQIYFLSMIGPQALDRTLFPLSDRTLEEVRTMVARLPLADDKESQDVCFLKDIDLMSFLRGRLPRLFEPGDILNTSGRVIGGHEGVVYFTIGQRRGTRFSSDRKLYVVGKDVAANTITLGEDADLMSDRLVVDHPVLWLKVVAGDVFQAKVRYLNRASEIEIVESGPDRLVGRFSEPVRAITPGQVAVFYRGDTITAAGFIA